MPVTNPTDSRCSDNRVGEKIAAASMEVPLRNADGKSSQNSAQNGDNSLDFPAASNGDVRAPKGGMHDSRECCTGSEFEEYGGFVGPARAVQTADADQAPIQVRAQSTSHKPDEAILAIARALAVRHAREDHAAELAGNTQVPSNRIL